MLVKHAVDDLHHVGLRSLLLAEEAVHDGGNVLAHAVEVAVGKAGEELLARLLYQQLHFLRHFAVAQGALRHGSL